MQQKKLFLIGIAFLFIANSACTQKVNDNSSTTKATKKDQFMQTAENRRLLTVITIYKSDDQNRFEITFLETPMVFELTLATAQDSLNYKMLIEAMEKKLPLNIIITTEQNKNSIHKVFPATDEQMKYYHKEKSEGKGAMPVPKPY